MGKITLLKHTSRDQGLASAEGVTAASGSFQQLPEDQFPHQGTVSSTEDKIPLPVTERKESEWRFQSSSYPENRTSFLFFMFIAIIAVLYFAREVLIPFALAILFSFALAPLVRRLERIKCNRIVAVSIACLITFGVISVVGWFTINQMVALVPKISEYQTNISKKVTTVKRQISSASARLTRTANDIENKLGGESALSPVVSSKTSTNSEVVVPVQVVAQPLGPLEVIRTTVISLLSPLGTLGLVIVFTVFILINREDLRNRFIRLIAHGQLSRTTQAIDEATTRVSRYLLTQLLLNISHGIIVTVGLTFLGIPNAAVWGILSATFRFIPYLGPWMSALTPIALSFAIFDGWTQPLLTIGFFIVLELISNNIMEPFLYGSSTGLSPVAILVAAVFWTWLWGGVGLLMSTPLTVCLLVVGRYVHQGEFLYILLGDQPMLPPPERFYQRLLSQDEEEAIEIVEEFLNANCIEALYDEVLIPALILCEEDRQRRILEGIKYQYIVESTRELIEELSERDRNTSLNSESTNLERSEVSSPRYRYVLCVPANDETDEIIARMLSHRLHRVGVENEVLATKLLSSEILDQVAQTNADCVCISALPPFALTHVRYVARKIHARFPKVKILVCLWHTQVDPRKTKMRLEVVGVSDIVTTISEAVHAIEG